MSDYVNMYAKLGIGNGVFVYGEAILEKLKPRFEEIDRIAEYNQLKVLSAMQECQVPKRHASLT